MMVKCSICGKEVTNIGVHNYHKHRDKATPETRTDMEEVKVDEHIPDKQLSSLISEVKRILRPYTHEIEVKTLESAGTYKDIEIIARIHPRR